MDFNNLSLVSIPRVESSWSKKDRWGTFKVRSSIGRNSYRVDPGLYKIGNPGNKDEVIVTSNYKLSFDIVRRCLEGINAWILILETYGINVWCAAGKGTFGSDELIRQIKDSSLQSYVSHKRLILPQLGAPGVAAHKIKDATGFSVKFGPVRAEDIKEYLASGLKKTEAMRSVQFNFRDRLLLAPVELVNSLKYLMFALIAILLISGISEGGYSLTSIWQEGISASLYLVLAYITGAFLAPTLLPWLPFRYFGGKGLVAGFLTYGLVALITFTENSVWEMAGWILISGAVSSFLTMNFTGASTYTSLSGVKKEMRIFVPLQLTLVITGLSIVILTKFL